MAQPTPFDGLKPFSFGGIEFPYKTYRVQGGIRKHEFNFPHTPGGVTEKLGRKLYEIHVTSNFTAGLTKRYPNLWADLAKLRKTFANQDTDIIGIPHIGPMAAFADTWTESVTGRDRSTIEVDMTFTEDMAEGFTASRLLDFSGSATMSDKLDTFNAEALRNELLLDKNTQNIFSAVNSVCSSILSVKDQLDLYGSLIVSKIDSATAIIRDADQQVRELNNPDFWPLLDSLHGLWFSTIQLQQDIQQSGAVIKTFTVPIRMTIAQASAAIFGDNSKAVDLMTLNPLDDPFSIPAGFQLNYYDNWAN
jgi:hypothetical protein